MADLTRRRMGIESASLLFLLAACRPAAEPYPIRIDSAGIEIVTNGSVMGAPSVVSFDTARQIDIGGLHDNPDLELRPRGMLDVLMLDDGRLLLSNSHEVRLYGAEGSLERVIGRQGEGPGEFAGAIWSLCRIRGDTILALEVPQPRIGVTDLTLSSLTTMTHSGRALPRACMSDGFIASYGTQSDPDEMDRPRAPYARVGATGAELQGLGVWPADAVHSYPPHEAAVAGEGEMIVVGDGLSFEYRQYGVNGTLKRIVRTADVAGQVSRDSLRTLFKASAPDGEAQSSTDARVDRALNGRSTVPVLAYQRLIVDAAGRVWMSQGRPDSKTLDRWVVFDSTGVLLGAADPNSASVLGEFWNVTIKWTAEHLVFTFRDDDGAAHVRLVPYRIGHLPR